MIKFYKSTELPDFLKRGYYNVMHFAIHVMSGQDPSPFQIFADGSTDDITEFKYVSLSNKGDKGDETTLDEAMITLDSGYYVCIWTGFTGPLVNGFGQFKVTNGTIIWYSEPFKIVSNAIILVTIGDFDSSFDFSFRSEERRVGKECTG
jgi:hypothetical protein